MVELHVLSDKILARRYSAYNGARPENTHILIQTVEVQNSTQILLRTGMVHNALIYLEKLPIFLSGKRLVY